MEWLVAHDAGGAELISAWAVANPRPRRGFVLEGPAVAVFRRKFEGLSVRCRDDFFSELAPGDHVLTGTGWASDLEKSAIVRAKTKGAKVSSFLDHWSNYAMRFLWNGQPCLPDEIWVGDRYALALAQKEFPLTPVREVPNDYLREIAEEIRRLEAAPTPGTESPRATRILYVCEALAERLGILAPGEGPEFEALERFLAWLKAQGPESSRVRLRLHPAEKTGKYDETLRKHPDLLLEISSGTSLAQDCAWAEWVVGMGSMALVVALAAGKRTFSCMPTPGQHCPLPHVEIRSL